MINKKAGEITREFYSFVIEKFNGYQTIKNELARKEQINLEPLCIVYDPSYFEDENVPVLCFFTDQIHLAYRSHVGKIVNEGKNNTST